jgi:DNA polymerase
MTAGREGNLLAQAAAARPLTQEQLFVLQGGPLEASALSVTQRQHKLAELAAQVARCQRCDELFATRTQTVFGVGPLDPEICFVGEAPGADEDRMGEPFVGRAGQLLTRIIEAMGLQRQEVYICNILKCRPPGNRVPTVQECRNCFPYFEQQFELVRPKFLVALGNTASRALLQTTLGVTRLRGRFHEYRGVPLVCTYHPSALLRDTSGQMKRETWEDMKMLLQRMGRPIPSGRTDNPRPSAG